MSITNQTDLSGLSKQYAARDLAAQTKLKYREIGQGAPDEHKRRDRGDLKKELEDRERSSKSNKRVSAIEPSKDEKSKKLKVVEAIQHNLDADEPIMLNENSDDSDEDRGSDAGDDDEDDDDTAELLAELDRIKKERAAEQAKQEAERKKEEERIRVENILKGNPLLQTASAAAGGSAKSDFKVKRRWDDDVVFKNCAKGDEKNEKKGFINDTLRSEFHKKFMERYVK